MKLLSLKGVEKYFEWLLESMKKRFARASRYIYLFIYFYISTSNLEILKNVFLFTKIQFLRITSSCFNLTIFYLKYWVFYRLQIKKILVLPMFDVVMVDVYKI